MSTPKTHPLSDAQILALAKFITDNGKHWRTQLDSAWMTGRYPAGADTAALQVIRNTVGPTRLARVKAADILAAARNLNAETDSPVVPDFRLDNHGSICVLWADSKAAQEWVAEHLPSDAPTWGRNGTGIEPRCVADIVSGFQVDGLTI